MCKLILLSAAAPCFAQHPGCPYGKPLFPVSSLNYNTKASLVQSLYFYPTAVMRSFMISLKKSIKYLWNALLINKIHKKGRKSCPNAVAIPNARYSSVATRSKNSHSSGSNVASGFSSSWLKDPIVWILNSHRQTELPQNHGMPFPSFLSASGHTFYIILKIPDHTMLAEPFPNFKQLQFHPAGIAKTLYIRP